MRLIGLHGAIGAGKDTVARMLVQRPDNIGATSFAAPIKDMLLAAFREFGLTRQLMEDRERKEKPLPTINRSPRELLQTLGTDWGRDLIHQELWILHAEERVRHFRKFCSALVITDVRFENEASWIRAQGGEVWHIVRKLPENVHALHPSEHGIEMHAGVDSVIVNDEGLEQLADQVLMAWQGELRIAQTVA